MSIEIERKFLVRAEIWAETPKPEGTLYRQGYLFSSEELTLRVRIAGEKGLLTFKATAPGIGSIARLEYEYPIPLADATDMLDRVAQAELSKKRYVLSGPDGKTWEVDDFLGLNAGLLLAEIELSDEQEHFAAPPWLGEEVTGDERYFNAYLARYPFSQWGITPNL